MLTFLLYIHIHLLTSSEVLSFFCFVNTYIYFLSPPLPSSSDNNTFCASSRYTFVSGGFILRPLALLFFVSTPPFLSSSSPRRCHGQKAQPLSSAGGDGRGLVLCEITMSCNFKSARDEKKRAARIAARSTRCILRFV